MLQAGSRAAAELFRSEYETRGTRSALRDLHMHRNCDTGGRVADSDSSRWQWQSKWFLASGRFDGNPRDRALRTSQRHATASVELYKKCQWLANISGKTTEKCHFGPGASFQAGTANPENKHVQGKSGFDSVDRCEFNRIVIRRWVTNWRPSIKRIRTWFV